MIEMFSDLSHSGLRSMVPTGAEHGNGRLQLPFPGSEHQNSTRYLGVNVTVVGRMPAIRSTR